MAKKYNTQSIRSLIHEELEPRLLFSADITPGLDFNAFHELVLPESITGEFQVESSSISENTNTIGTAAIQASYADLPLAFEQNTGQTDPAVDFLSRGNGYTVFLTDSDAVLVRVDVLRRYLRGTKNIGAVNAPRALSTGILLATSTSTSGFVDGLL